MEPTAAVCKPEEGEVVPATIAVIIGEINSGDGLRNGHGFAARDVFSCGFMHRENGLG